MVGNRRSVLLGCGVTALLLAGLSAGHAQGVMPDALIRQKMGLTPKDAVDGGRGIHPAGQPAKAPAPGPAPAATDNAVDLTVRFATGSAELTSQAVAQLNELGAALKSAPDTYRFRVEGHTDTVGTREANKALSQRRADAVVAYLTAKFGIAAARLEAVGRGEEKLLVQTPDQTPEPANRRVTVINLGA